MQSVAFSAAQSSHISQRNEPAASSRRARSGIAALLALGLSAVALTVIAPGAYAATTTATYISDEDGVTTSDVTASVIDSNTTALTGGWYVCEEALTAPHAVVTSSGATNLILGDACAWNVDALSVSSGSLTIWSGINNTGSLTAKAQTAPGVIAQNTREFWFRPGTY